MMFALRKIIAEHFPGAGGNPKIQQPDGTWQEEVPVRFLYVDSSPYDLERKWLVTGTGENVTLDTKQRLLIRNGDVSKVLDSPAEDNRHISSWLGDTDLMKKQISNTDGSAGAGQIRRIGRFLFANSAHTFCATVTNILAGFGEEGATFHLCGGLGGGTGSGSIVDAAAQIRSLRPDSGLYKIFVYTTIQAEPPKGWDIGVYLPNQYAALKELNALAGGFYFPDDVGNMAESKKWYGQVPVSACLVVADASDNGTKLNFKPEQGDFDPQAEIWGNWLFQRIIGMSGPHVPAAFAVAMNLENLSPSYPSEEDARSYRFGTVGIKRWVIPEGETRERFTLAMMASAAKQMLYANWADKVGFLDRSSSRPLPEDWHGNKNNEKWGLSDHQLQLSATRVQGETTFEKAWQDVAKAARAGIETRKLPIKKWAEEVDENFRSNWESGFRKLGVESYFAAAKSRLDRRADEIMDTIAADLWSAWQSGERGLAEIRNCLRELKSTFENRLKALPETRVKTDVLEKLRKSAADRSKSLEKLGPISSRLPWIRNKHLSDLLSLEQQRHINQTRNTAIDNQIDLLRILSSRTEALARKLDGVIASLEKLAASCDTEAAKRCQPQNTGTLQASTVIRELDITAIKRMEDELVAAREASSASHAESCRTAVVEACKRHGGNLPSLGNLDYTTLEQLLVSRSSKTVEDEHTRLTNADCGFEPVLGISLVERLRRKYDGSGAALEEDVETFLRGAVAAARIDRTQTQPKTVLRNANVPPMPQQLMAIFIPSADANDAFVTRLVEAFKNGLPAHEHAHTTISILPSVRSNEITIVSTYYWMAARFFGVLRTLSVAYASNRKAVNKEAKQDLSQAGWKFLHLEDSNVDLPDLFRDGASAQTTQLVSKTTDDAATVGVPSTSL